MKSQLADIIISILRRYPMLCYFQGYHDIVQVLLLVLGPEAAAKPSAFVSLLRIRDFMLPSLSASLDHLQILPAILHRVNPKLCTHLSQTKPFFALSSTLTLYAHDIQDYGDIARLFDFLLAHEASVSLYFFAVIILSREKELFDIEPDDSDMLHFTLSKLPKPLNLEYLITRTLEVFEEHPPTSLPFGAWNRVSRFSALKTSRSTLETCKGVPAHQTLRDGIAFFQKQAKEIQRFELQKRIRQTLWKNRRPIGSIGIAIVIGILSMWIQKDFSSGVPGIATRCWRYLRSFRI